MNSEDNMRAKEYTAEDISRYINGLLSPAEMHAMERAALDDPFLADAMEGMQSALEQHDEQTVKDHLEQIRAGITKRSTGKKKTAPVVRFRWWQVGAAAAVLITAGVLVYRSSTTEKYVIAKTESQETPVPSLKRDDSATVPAGEVELTDTVATLKPSAPLKQVPKREEATITPSQIPATSPDVRSKAPADEKKENDGKKQEASPSIALEDRAADTIRYKSEVVVTASADRKASASASTTPQTYAKGTVAGVNFKAMKNFSGRVTDYNNNAIANAAVRINNEKNPLLTDREGFFKFSRPDSTIDVHVSVTGYSQKTFSLSNSTTVNKLQLKPERAAQGYTTNTDGYSKNTDVRKMNAEPINGWPSFYAYIDSNKLSFPDNMRGVVWVSFVVNRRGEIFDLAVEESLGEAQDAEAIRLVRQGPAWKVTKGREATVRLVIRF